MATKKYSGCDVLCNFIIDNCCMYSLAYDKLVYLIVYWFKDHYQLDNFSRDKGICTSVSYLRDIYISLSSWQYNMHIQQCFMAFFLWAGCKKWHSQSMRF